MTSPELEVRLHGRGGQGTVTMAALLVDAAWRGGWHALGFPSFGTERTGAPVAAFVRLSHEPIRNRSEVRKPSLVVVQDPSLVDAVDITAGLAEDGLVLLNALQAPHSLDAFATIAVPVTELAVRHIGAPITSTAMLGVVAATTTYVTIDDVCAAIASRLPARIADANVAVARAAYAAALEEPAA